MTELINALTRAATAVAVYYEKAASPIVKVPQDVVVDAPDGPASVDAELRTRVPRKPRAPKAPVDQMAPLPVVVTAIPEMSETDSAVKVIEVATRYIHRFKTRTPIDGKAEAIAILKDKWGELGVTGITKTATNPGLNHAQRLEFMAILNANMAAADGAAVAGNA